MRSRRLFMSFGLVSLVLLGVLIPLATLQAGSRAQDNPVVLSVAVPGFLKDLFTDRLIADFEAAVPGVTLNVVGSDTFPGSVSMDGVKKYIENMQKFAALADVLYTDANQDHSPVATRAGLFLDLAPLANGDKALAVEDFYPAVWRSYQWDNGQWAIPISADAIAWLYRPDAFDKAGVAYPNDKWTMDDLATAVRKLAIKDADGKISQKGIDIIPGFNDGPLFRSLLGTDLFDSTAVPNMPLFSKPELEALIKAWVDLDSEGVIGTEFGKAPLTIGSVTQGFFSAMSPDPDQKRATAPLPGGKAIIRASGFAVSAGTQHPEQAYALARFLSTRPEFAGRFGATPARKSLAGKTGDASGPVLNVPPELQATINQALETGLPMSSLNYTDYLSQAIQKMKSDKLDVKTALQNAESLAVKDLQAASDRKPTLTVSVATPIPTPMMAAGKIALKFGIGSFISPMPNQDKWDALIREFAQNDPQVGQVTLGTGQDAMQVGTAASKFDCFYMPYNAVRSAQLSKLLNLDPYLAADSSFDKSDVFPGVLAQLQRDNKTWAIPLSLEPSILKYDSSRFSKDGIPAPKNGWTVDALADALKALKTDPKGNAPLASMGEPGGAYLLMLIAAYGGLPLDYRTNPLTINFTDPATVTAIREVLDLAKKGFIKYESLADVGRVFISINGGNQPPIYTDRLNAFSAGMLIVRNDTSGSDGSNPKSPYRAVSYPKGTKYTPVSYTIGTAYISATAQNPDACYRWISTLARHPELFASMPARRSLVNDPTFAQTQGDDVVEFYKQFDSMLQDPHLIEIPSGFNNGAGSGFIIEHWLYEAFDNYVLKDGDLDGGLKSAEDMGKAYSACVGNLPDIDFSDPAEATQYLKQIGGCAVKIDPKLKPLFDSIK